LTEAGQALLAARGLALGRVPQVRVPGLDLRRAIWVACNVNCSLTRAQEILWAFVAERRLHQRPKVGLDRVNACAELLSRAGS
jgi:hypothetical protein